MQGYLPLPKPLRSSTLVRKREEYLSLVELAFARDREGLDQQIWHQIEIDVPRTRPGVQLWMHGSTQRVSPRFPRFHPLQGNKTDRSQYCFPRVRNGYCMFGRYGTLP